MNYRNALRALSARIRPLAEAGEIHTRRMAVNSGDSYGTPVRGNYGEGGRGCPMHSRAAHSVPG